jgi:hypothetical protein
VTYRAPPAVSEIEFSLKFKHGYWWWHCFNCEMGDHFITRPRTLESIDTHLRVKHRELAKRDREVAGQR